MPAKLVITEGDPAGREIPIQFPVLRIGSGASCEVQVRGIADVAATLRYDQGRYQVLNRCATPITLNGATLAPQQSGMWPAQTLLRLTPQCALTLEIEGDPAPRNTQPLSRESIDQVSQPELHERDVDEDEDAAPREEAVAKPKSNPQKNFQMAVIGLCVLGGAYLQYADYQKKNGGGSTSATGVISKKILQEKFAWLIADLRAREVTEEKSGHFRYGMLRETLQEARIADLREDWNSAAYEYREILDRMEALDLVPAEEEAGEEPIPVTKPISSLRLKTEEEYRKVSLEKRLSEYVRQRLTQIDPKVSKFTNPDL